MSSILVNQKNVPVKKLKIIISFCFILTLVSNQLHAQFLMDMVDTTKNVGKGLLGLYQKYDHIRIGGYIQPQFQVAGNEGIKSYEGGDFGSQVSNRFMLRRSRIRIDYINFGAKDHSGPGVQIVFQFDANERTFSVRDLWGRVFENKFKLFSFTTGMFARPFGFELNYSSSDRESPERGRMSQILMKGERDLGVMVSFDARREIGIFNKVKMDIGLFNGQGINAAGDFDNIKDLIARVAARSIRLNKILTLSGGISTLEGGLMQNTKYKYFTGVKNGILTSLVDSGNTNLFGTSPRRYWEADAQIRIKNRIGFSEFRAEFVTGRQTGTSTSSETPVALLTGTDGFHVRKFNGAYFYYIQNLFSLKNQLVIKYDRYDPNIQVKGSDIGVSGSNLTSANIKYNTLGIGYVNYLTENIKFVLYYAKVMNEKTQLKGYTSDLKDDVLTFRMQFRF